MFSAQAQLRDDQIAVADSRESWSYQELDSRSNQLANYLRAAGIRTGDVVAIYGHRSLALVWAILAVLKAGAAFMILDPDYPVERLMSCLEIASPRGWLQLEAAGALPQLLDQFVETLAGCRLELTTRAGSVVNDLLASYSIENPLVPIGADDLAYCFYLRLERKAERCDGPAWPTDAVYLLGCRRIFAHQRDRFCMLGVGSRSAASRHLHPLQPGGTVCIPDQQDLESPARLRAWMKQEDNGRKPDAGNEPTAERRRHDRRTD